MINISDERYGKKGLGIWFYVPRLFAIILVVIALYRVFSIMDFSEYPAVHFIMILTSFYVVYLLVGNVQILFEAPHVLQSIFFQNKIYLKLYFGKEVVCSLDDFSGVKVHKVNRLMSVSSLLDRHKDNYLVLLKDGRSFYLNGSLKGTDEFVGMLKSKLNNQK